VIPQPSEVKSKDDGGCFDFVQQLNDYLIIKEHNMTDSAVEGARQLFKNHNVPDDNIPSIAETLRKKVKNLNNHIDSVDIEIVIGGKKKRHTMNLDEQISRLLSSLKNCDRIHFEPLPISCWIC
jgi:acetate kinase